MAGQLLLDFLSQPGPQVDLQRTRHKLTEFAEELGDLAAQWLDQQRELERQVRVPLNPACILNGMALVSNGGLVAEG